MSNATQTQTTPDLTTVVDAYIASWAEADPEKRAALVRQAFVPEATMTDPLLSLKGYEALATVAPTLQEHFPGHTIRRTGDVDAHHNLFRFTWDMVDPDGNTVMAGIDVGIVADDGRMSAIAGFFDQS